MSQLDHTGMPVLKNGEFAFQFEHPGRRYCYVKKSGKMRIPKLSMPKGMLCDLEELELDVSEPSGTALERRENYSKIALLLSIHFGTKIFSVLMVILLFGKNYVFSKPASLKALIKIGFELPPFIILSKLLSFNSCIDLCYVNLIRLIYKL